MFKVTIPGKDLRSIVRELNNASTGRGVTAPIVKQDRHGGDDTYCVHAKQADLTPGQRRVFGL